MANSDSAKSELEIKSDSDWKQRVRKEAAQLDAERNSQPSPADTTAAAVAAPVDAADEGFAAESASQSEVDAGRFPVADFTMLVTMFATQAMVALGLVPNPVDGQADRDLGLARHFIDLLAVLQEKTRRNLTGHEARLIEQSLHELRMAYVELSRAENPS